ncbi:hypothetical protein C8R31_10574 [Nitrosospira sp. Nsp2]|nr:hypothetical protein C8R31_10574 [Nitrosospira sp. Nsp2]
MLSALRAHLEAKPDFYSSRIDSPVQLEWLGKAVTLVSRWNRSEGILLQGQINSLNPLFLAAGSLVGIYTRLYAAVADLELQVPASSGEVFAPGAVYDFFRAVREQILSAKTSLLIVDPYMDADSFHKYFYEVLPSVGVYLLVKAKRDGKPTQYIHALKGAVNDFINTYGGSIELRLSKELHDRAVILDTSTVWVIGQSIKDAARSSPTYLIRLDGDIAKLKREHYGRIWDTALLA